MTNSHGRFSRVPAEEQLHGSGLAASGNPL